MLGERHNQARPQEQVASNEDRTRDLALTKRMLCQLSYEGEAGYELGGGHRACGGVWWPRRATASDPA